LLNRNAAFEVRCFFFATHLSCCKDMSRCVDFSQFVPRAQNKMGREASSGVVAGEGGGDNLH